MKFERYLGESDQKVIEEILKVISTLCRPFLKEMGSFQFQQNPIFRGMRENISTYAIKKGTRTSDRKPKFTVPEVFEIFDKAFAEKFGWWVRSKGVFTGDVGTAGGYGNPYLFFPIGKYKYVWSNNFRGVWYNLTSPKIWEYMTDKEKKEDIKETKQLVKGAVNAYKDKALLNAVNSHNDFECIFQCKKYIVVNREVAGGLVQLM